MTYYEIDTDTPCAECGGWDDCDCDTDPLERDSRDIVTASVMEEYL